MSDAQATRTGTAEQVAFDRLAAGPHLGGVLAANAAYLTAALSEPADLAGRRWVLACLPDSVAGRLSAISMARIDTFVLHAPLDPGCRRLPAYAVVRRSTLAHEFGSLADFEAAYPGLTVLPSAYRDAGNDQVQVDGWHDTLIAALGDERFAPAVRAVAGQLMVRRAANWPTHNHLLATRVLSRVALIAGPNLRQLSS